MNHTPAFAVVFLLGLFFSCTKPAVLEKISNYPHPRSAFLVLDLQEDFTGAKARFPADSRQVERTLHWANWVIDGATVSNFLVVYIRNEFEPGGIENFVRGNAAVKGSPGIELDRRLKIVGNHAFSKNKGDAFSSRALENFLKTNQISRLYLAGLMGSACVLETVQGALGRGYDVRVLGEAVADRSLSRRDKSLEKMKQLGAKIVTAYDIIQTEALDLSK
ncbi:MAG: cysteine hydrolase [Spirochaetia bacterium]|nr:cysteine hydrolase [Spirochaetia bacterium]